jgi:hypothetical protein
MLIFRFKKLSSWLKNNFLDLILVLIILGVGIFVAFRNYVPGTWLLGWDNLLPELNFKLNIARSFSAVWQEYQGLGLLGGMAHAADLPRQLILWIASIFIPTSFIRYFWTFLMLCLGPLGVYFLIRVEKKFVSSIAGFTGAIFYLFNLATLQTFFTPFETFVSFYGFFPWLLYFAGKYLRGGKWKDLLIFAIVSFLATSSFYVQTLFIVYAIFLSVFALETCFRLGKKGILQSLRLGFVTLFVNAFWLLPVIYFALVSPGIPGNSHINSIATPETQLMNQARSGLTNIATLKGYWFDYFDWSKIGNYDYLYKDWISHSSNFLVTGLSLALFLTSSAGLILAVTKKDGFKFSYLILLIFSYFMLAGAQIPTPFFSEAFRNAFTKWSVPLALILSVGLGSFIRFIGGLFSGRLGIFLSVLISICVVSTSIYIVSPVFNGKLIANSMRVNLPSYYQETVDYFDDLDPTKRVAAFPLTDFWGWQINDWGYRGSGFLWYGIPQPILSRTFDVWSPNNEGFYTDISHAIKSGDRDELAYVLNKYQVGYILFDGSVVIPGDPNSASRLRDQKEFLESSGTVVREKEFGKITLYKVTTGDTNSFVNSPKTSYDLPFINLGQAGEVIVKEDFSDSQGYLQAKNCNLKGLGSVVKEKHGGGNYYEAENNGVSCDYFYYPTLDSSKAYFMRIKGRNLSGRSLKFYLYSVEKQAIVAEGLLTGGDFDNSYDVLPLSKAGGGGGYTLNVETRSFGKVKSENLVTDIEFYPVDFDYAGGTTEISNNLVIKNVRKYGTWAYKVDIQGYGLMQLGQGYEDGWISYPSLSHVNVNSWSNGWVVPQAKIPDSRFQTLIIYWPQLLEWGGFVLGAGLTLILFRLYLQK